MFTSKQIQSGFRSETIKALLVLLCLTEVLSTFGWAQQPSRSPSAEETTLKSFLRDYLGKPDTDEDKDVQYLVAWVDLNDDGKQEAIVYVYGRSWCGTGGCVTLVLTHHESTYNVVTKITITRPPIRMMVEKSHGWHDISVIAGGGGIPAHEARLSFNGETYPSNPTVTPAQPIKGAARGRTLIRPTDTKAQFVYR